MRRTIAAGFMLTLALGLAGAGAAPIFKRGGTPIAVPAPAFACDGGGSGVCADFAAGQTFVQWPDVQTSGTCDITATFCTDYTKRYRVVRSNAPITSGNFGAATVIAAYDLPNSGQLTGGNPDVVGGATYCQADRQNNPTINCGLLVAPVSTASLTNSPMAKIPDAQTGGGALKQLAYATGLQVYTALATENAYYAVISTNTSNASPSYIGSVGPIAESVATARPVLFAQRTTGTGHITYSGGLPTGTTGLPIVLELGGSDSGAGGTSGSSTIGDYFSSFGDTTEHWQDGLQRSFSAFKDRVGGTRYPSLPNTLVMGSRSTIWNPNGLLSSLGNGGMETGHLGIGMTPLNGTANRIYTTTQTSNNKFLTWMGSYYGADLNQIHATGSSLGAIGEAQIGSHQTNGIQLASVWMAHPLFRLDVFRASYWVGELWGGTIASPWPFAGTLHDGPQTLGTNPAIAQMSDGTSWQTYAKLPDFWAANPGLDLPFFGWQDSKDDVNLATSGAGSFQQMIDGVVALQDSHHGHAFTFFMGAHDTGYPSMGSINCDWLGAISGVCYNKSQFALNVPYLAFDHSSIDDAMSTVYGTAARTAAGIWDGDPFGCINCGFTWNITADTSGTFSFTVGNSWMGRPATPIPSSTISSVMLASGTTSFTVLDVTGFLGTGIGNDYFFVGGTEVIRGSRSGNTITIGARGILGTSAGVPAGRPHSIGDSIVQWPTQATGPNIGAQTTMTVNVTPRRVQNFIKVDGTVLNCSYTPFGGSATPLTPTVTDGIFTLNGVVINVGGNTAIACS